MRHHAAGARLLHIAGRGRRAIDSEVVLPVAIVVAGHRNVAAQAELRHRPALEAADHRADGSAPRVGAERDDVPNWPRPDETRPGRPCRPRRSRRTEMTRGLRLSSAHTRPRRRRDAQEDACTEQARTCAHLDVHGTRARIACRDTRIADSERRRLSWPPLRVAHHHLMRILITGGAGFVGASLALMLKRDLPEVRCAPSTVSGVAARAALGRLQAAGVGIRARGRARSR